MQQEGSFENMEAFPVVVALLQGRNRNGFVNIVPKNEVLLDLSAISPVDVPQPWHILVFSPAKIALIYLMTKANHVIAQICHFTSFGRLGENGSSTNVISHS